jgi:hypothetical protein
VDRAGRVIHAIPFSSCGAHALALTTTAKERAGLLASREVRWCFGGTTEIQKQIIGRSLGL